MLHFSCMYTNLLPNMFGGSASNQGSVGLTGMVGSVPTSFSIEFFDQKIQKFERWVQRLEGVFEIFKITDSTLKKNYLLHYIGVKAFEIVCDTLATSQPKEKKYEEIIDVLKSFYDSKPVEIAEYYKYHHRAQQEGETIKEYVAVLQKMATHCGFGSYLTTAVRNQLVCGLRNKKIQQTLLEHSDLTLERALEIGVDMETSSKNNNKIETANHMLPKDTQHKGNMRVGKVNYSNISRVKKIEIPRGRGNCHRCGAQHYPSECEHKKSRCSLCKRFGHIERACRSKNRFKSSAPQHRTKPSLTDKGVTTNFNQRIHIPVSNRVESSDQNILNIKPNMEVKNLNVLNKTKPSLIDKGVSSSFDQRILIPISNCVESSDPNILDIKPNIQVKTLNVLNHVKPIDQGILKIEPNVQETLHTEVKLEKEVSWHRSTSNQDEKVGNIKVEPVTFQNITPSISENIVSRNKTELIVASTIKSSQTVPQILRRSTRIKKFGI